MTDRPVPEKGSPGQRRIEKENPAGKDGVFLMRLSINPHGYREPRLTFEVTAERHQAASGHEHQHKRCRLRNGVGVYTVNCAIVRS